MFPPRPLGRPTVARPGARAKSRRRRSGPVGTSGRAVRLKSLSNRAAPPGEPDRRGRGTRRPSSPVQGEAVTDPIGIASRPAEWEVRGPIPWPTPTRSPHPGPRGRVWAGSPGGRFHAQALAQTLCLTLGLAGCLGDESGRDPFALRNPFRDERRFDPSSAAASAKAATQVHTVGSAVVAANSTDFPSKPVFLTIGLPEPMVFHQGTGQIVVSEGLVNRCGSEAELAAVICHELGKMAAEHPGKGPPRPERDLPPPSPAPWMWPGRRTRRI